MVLTWVFAICFLNPQGQCHAYRAETNFAYLPLDMAHTQCKLLLRDNPGEPEHGFKNVCIKAYQFDTTYGEGK